VSFPSHLLLLFLFSQQIMYRILILISIMAFFGAFYCPKVVWTSENSTVRSLCHQCGSFSTPTAVFHHAVPLLGLLQLPINLMWFIDQLAFRLKLVCIFNIHFTTNNNKKTSYSYGIGQGRKKRQVEELLLARAAIGFKGEKNLFGRWREGFNCSIEQGMESI